jgi:hypothetical protein
LDGGDEPIVSNPNIWVCYEKMDKKKDWSEDLIPRLFFLFIYSS